MRDNSKMKDLTLIPLIVTDDNVIFMLFFQHVIWFYAKNSRTLVPENVF
jgi:hypothetical protein